MTKRLCVHYIVFLLLFFVMSSSEQLYADMRLSLREINAEAISPANYHKTGNNKNCGFIAALIIYSIKVLAKPACANVILINRQLDFNTFHAYIDKHKARVSPGVLTTNYCFLSFGRKTVPAINRAIIPRLKRHLCSHTALSANSFVHFTLRSLRKSAIATALFRVSAFTAAGRFIFKAP